MRGWGFSPLSRLSLSQAECPLVVGQTSWPVSFAGRVPSIAKNSVHTNRKYFPFSVTHSAPNHFPPHHPPPPQNSAHRRPYHRIQGGSPSDMAGPEKRAVLSPLLTFSCH